MRRLRRRLSLFEGKANLSNQGETRGNIGRVRFLEKCPANDPV
ncbi:hypothetical protein AciX8_0310 [Granulicella mallensis MP5ACTX8]|uniref:Uncharacterized protein n=1 Tax=Granulicella mallensis (strain ATCC BAA-1857 / DSM 23137 / MP5ACTX8) TaxID=682795 RepID=G8P0Q7_GRAMM|nr:hypothetical protein AciX8_0310 [Granulicella mallensis MP5ACTX8]